MPVRPYDQEHSSSRRRASAVFRFFSLKSHSGGPSKAPVAFHVCLRFLLRCYYPSRASCDPSKCTGSSSSSGDLYSCLCTCCHTRPASLSGRPSTSRVSDSSTSISHLIPFPSSTREKANGFTLLENVFSCFCVQ